MSQGLQERPRLHPYAASTLAAEAQPNIYSGGPSLSHSQQLPMNTRPGPPRAPAHIRHSTYARPPVGGNNHVSVKLGKYITPTYPHLNAIPKSQLPPNSSRSIVSPIPHSRPPAVSSRIANTNAAIAAIQAVAPPVVQPVPVHRPLMALAGLPNLSGGNIKGSIKFDHEKGVKVIDEITAQKSAAEFSIYLDNTRKRRRTIWNSYWSNRLDLNRRVLLTENQCFKEATEAAAELDDSDDEDLSRRSRAVVVPYVYHNTGSFDVEVPPKVIMPDPEIVLMRTQPNQRAQEHSQLVHHVQRPFYHSQPGSSVGAVSSSHMGPSYSSNMPDQGQPALLSGPNYDAKTYSSVRQRAAQQVFKGNKFG